jgi:acyl-CoA thioester hydrolase
VDVLYKTEVTPDQIDHLGHMNVRYYGESARTGAQRLLASLGFESDGDRTVVQRDTYVRHHREQLVGAPLEVRGGVLDASSERIRLYEELANTDTGDVAAAFVLTFESAEPTSRARLAINDTVVEQALAATVPVPEHGRPRSIAIDDDPAARAPSFATITDRGLAIRNVRTIGAAECDAEGNVAPTAIAELVWGGEVAPGNDFRPFETLPGGGQMGFATMETRATWARFVRAGDHVQSFGADLDIQSKTMLSRNWVYDVDRGDLVAVFSVVSLAFDLEARRSAVIPDEVRERMARRLHPDLG